MKASVTVTPCDGKLHVHLFTHNAVGLPTEIVMEKLEKGFSLDKGPTFKVSRQDLVELTRCLVDECRRNGLIPQEPSAAEMHRIIEHRDSLAAICNVLAKLALTQAIALRQPAPEESTLGFD